jgi:DNA methylase
MFPEEFAEKQIRSYSSRGDLVCDPFSGRGTTLLQGLLLERRAVAVDINPVAYCISAAKAEVPRLGDVRREITGLENRYGDVSQVALERERLSLPRFFRRAFYHSTLSELLFLRSALNWRGSRVHRFIAALVLGSLHGEMDKSSSYFSNQMPRTISTKPDYSIDYWDEHGLWPKKRDVFDLLRKRAKFRLREEDVPALSGEVALGDARASADLFSESRRKVKLILTSPPYLNVTNYEEDQWLRLWFLGNEPCPTYNTISKDDRHLDPVKYWGFLKEVWRGIEPLLSKGATLVCRIGAKDLKRDEVTDGLTESLKEIFSRLRRKKPPVVSRIRNRQTEYFRPGSKGCLYEMDFAFSVT